MPGSPTSWRSPSSRSRCSSARTTWSPKGEAEAGSTDAFDEIDLRAEDDALIAAELEAAEAEAEARAEAEAEARAAAADDEDEDDDEDGNGDAPAARRRGRRGGRRRRTGRAGSAALEGTFDHGEEGYGLWLDPAVEDNPVYAEHWAGHRPVQITIEQDQIVIRRSPSEDDDAD